MSISDWSNQYLLSRPVRLYWAGWETNTYLLQKNGWSLSAQQDVASGSLRLGIQNRELQVQGLTEALDWRYQHASVHQREEILDHVIFRTKMAHRMNVVVQGVSSFAFQPIDAEPMVTTSPVRTLEDLCHFAVPLTRTQEIVVPEPDVMELLEKILQKQEPARNEYFKQMVDDEKFNKSRQVFHAQIVSIAA